MLRLYEAIRSTLLDRLRYTSLHFVTLRYTIVHWINQPIICVIRVQTCIITSNCRCPQVSIISDLSRIETVDAKQMVSNWPAVVTQGRDFNPIHYRSISSAYKWPANRVVRLHNTEDTRVSKGMVVSFTNVQSLNGHTFSNTSSLPGIQYLEDDP